MIHFNPIALTDRTRIDSILRPAGRQGAEYCFSTLFMWAHVYGSLVATTRDRLYVRSHRGPDSHYFYMYPLMASPQDVPVEEAIDTILNDALPHHTPIIGSLTPALCQAIEQAYPGRFKMESWRDTFDYIYNASDLATLAGKKYQPKRNHLSAFLRDYPHARVQRIEVNNLEQCLHMSQEWCASMDCVHLTGLQQESCAVRRALEAFEALHLEGLLVRLDDQIVAFTVGERLNDNTFLVHIEKAFPQYRGLYQFINKSFVEYVVRTYPEVIYINREDDNGDLGLRQAKETYHPAYMLEKYTATLRPTP